MIREDEVADRDPLRLFLADQLRDGDVRGIAHLGDDVVRIGPSVGDGS